MEEKICCLCKEEFKGYGNNAQPLMEGVCCDQCNVKLVFPARIKNLKGARKK